MSDEKTEKITEINESLLFILGVATYLIIELGDFAPEESKAKIKWLLSAIDTVVYKEKPLFDD